MNMTFNLGSIHEQNIIIMLEEDGTIEAHTSSMKEIHEAELELAPESGKKVLFKMEVPKT